MCVCISGCFTYTQELWFRFQQKVYRVRKIFFPKTTDFCPIPSITYHLPTLSFNEFDAVPGQLTKLLCPMFLLPGKDLIWTTLTRDVGVYLEPK